MTRTLAHFAAVPAFVAACAMASTASGQVAPPLGAAQQFGVLGSSAVTGATGGGVLVRGDVGSSPTPTISNFPPSSTVPPFTVHSANDGVVQQAHIDAIAAHTALLIQGSGTVLPDDLGTVGALGPGIYSFVTGAADLPASANLTLNGSGIFIFNVASTLTANVLSNVVGTADPCNIYWRVGSSATLNGSTFKGTVIAGASITVGAGASLTGRALAGAAAGGAVTMAGSGGNTIGGCSTPGLNPVCPVISIGPPALPIARVGAAYTQTLTASGGSAPYTFSLVSGTLPAGLTLTAGGVLSGVPTTAGSSAIVIRATDANGCFAQRAYTLVVPAASCPVIAIVPPTLPDGALGVAYSQQLTASGGTGPYVFTVLTGTLPDGLTLSAGGLLSGTPTSAGHTTVTIQAADGHGCPALITYTVTVLTAVPTLPQAFVLLLALGLAGVGYSRLRQRTRAE